MVNIKYFVDGEKILENEYNNTSFTNFNDIIKKDLLDKNFIYKITIIRCKTEYGNKFYKEYYILPLEYWQVYNQDGSKHIYRDFYVGAGISSQWKIYFNKTDVKFIKIEDVIDDNIKSSGHFVDKNTKIQDLKNYEGHVTEILDLTLNKIKVNYVRFDDLKTCNVLTRNVKIMKEISAQKYYYCNIL